MFIPLCLAIHEFIANSTNKVGPKSSCTNTLSFSTSPFVHALRLSGSSQIGKPSPDPLSQSVRESGRQPLPGSH